jgi:hypothetical protein
MESRCNPIDGERIIRSNKMYIWSENGFENEKNPMVRE